MYDLVFESVQFDSLKKLEAQLSICAQAGINFITENLHEICSVFLSLKFNDSKVLISKDQFLWAGLSYFGIRYSYGPYPLPSSPSPMEVQGITYGQNLKLHGLVVEF